MKKKKIDEISAVNQAFGKATNMPVVQSIQKNNGHIDFAKDNKKKK